MLPHLLMNLGFAGGQAVPPVGAFEEVEMEGIWGVADEHRVTFDASGTNMEGVFAPARELKSVWP